VEAAEWRTDEWGRWASSIQNRVPSMRRKLSFLSEACPNGNIFLV
jgi:hypothetical protein